MEDTIKDELGLDTTLKTRADRAKQLRDERKTIKDVRRPLP